jgi:Ni,Fe-hydrogenase I cytochrome b subunit
VSFKSEYLQNTTRFNSNIRKLFWVTVALMVVCLLVVTYFQISRPHLQTDPSQRNLDNIVTIFVNLLDFFSQFFFWYIFAVTGWLFVFFKMQDRVYTFMPGLDTWRENYKQYDWLFGFVAGTKLLIVLFKIYFKQSSMKLFMIDWERPKFHVQTYFE